MDRKTIYIRYGLNKSIPSNGKEMGVRITARTNVGKERTNNEDAFLVCPDLQVVNGNGPSLNKVSIQEGETWAVVADGMGGENAGEIASKTAVDALKLFYEEERPIRNFTSDRDVLAFMQDGIRRANDAIRRRIEKEPENAGMGTTIVWLCVYGQKAYIAWCGDSRCYVFNPQKGLVLLTKDHSYVQELIDQGVLSEFQTFTHPANNVITRYLGGTGRVSSPDVAVFDIYPHDIIMLCTDGLSGLCPNATIERVLQSSNVSDLDGAADALIETALQAGGYDNVTVLLVVPYVEVEEERCSVIGFLKGIWQNKFGHKMRFK